MEIRIVENKDKNRKLKEYLMSELEFSGRLVKRLLSEGLVSVDGKKGYGDTKLKQGMEIKVEEFEKKDNLMLLPEDLKLQIIEETESFIAVNKPAGMVMMPSEKVTSGTLANGISFIFKEKGIEAPVRFLNRLDRDTSGIVIVPLSGFYHNSIQLAYENGEKLYYAIVDGCPEKGEGTIDAPLMKDYEKKGGVKISSIGVEAVTSYKVIERFQSYSLLELNLLTGRTHQIRAHLKHIGCPIVGDVLYGGSIGLMERQALHAYRISFKSPEDGLLVEIECDLPEDMKLLLEKLREGKL